jgi:chaperone modulatory protein CbpM
MVRLAGDTLLDATIVDERMEVTLAELCRACAADAEQIFEMVEIGLLEPRGGGTAEWRFSGVALYRARTALRLRRDLQVNLAGAALALDLLEEIRSLRRRLGGLE